jgi:PTH1 family peptidyl-tRNA hydrolase
MQESKIKYIVAGLGNPGEKYLYTRHNAGFLALDYISEKFGFKINKLKYRAYCARYHMETLNTVNDENGGEMKKSESFDVLFMKPQTFMNNSGEAVSEAARFYKITPENILVISDDISLPPGKVRIRSKGSDGGQKGLRSITEHLNSGNFPRIKIGVGEKPHPDYDLAEWVTSKIPKEDWEIVFETLGKVYECVNMFLHGFTIEQIQNKYN